MEGPILRLGSNTFVNNEEMESVVHDYFEELDDSHYKQGIEAMFFFICFFFFLLGWGLLGLHLYYLSHQV